MRQVKEVLRQKRVLGRSHREIARSIGISAGSVGDTMWRAKHLGLLDWQVIHLLETAGNAALMTTELKATLAEHAAGNYRVLMNLADELLTAALERDQAQLDEKLFFDVFTPPKPKKTAARKR